MGANIRHTMDLDKNKGGLNNNSMRIVVSQEQTHSTPGSAFFLVLLVGSVAYSLYAYGTPMIWVGGGAGLLALSGFLHESLKHEVLLLIDDDGIDDRRLGMGKISWDDVEDAQLLVTEGNRFLGLRVKDPEKYLARLNGPHRRLFESRRRLGFNGINIDIWALDVNLLELKRAIDKRIRR